MLTPLGIDLNSSWEGLTQGRSGIGPITAFDATEFSVRFGGGVPDFDVAPYIPVKEARRMDGFIQYGLVAGIHAMQDSGLDITDSNRRRIGVAVGSGIGGICLLYTSPSPRDS